MSAWEIALKSLAEMENLGVRLGRLALPGDVICLDGELGTGKTTLTQAIAKGLDVPSSYYVTSPSFAILHEYPGRMPLYHMDFYRLNDSLDVENLGFEEYFSGSGLTVIEWGERAPEILPQERLGLHLMMPTRNERVIRCTYVTHHWQERLQRDGMWQQTPGHGLKD